MSLPAHVLAPDLPPSSRQQAATIARGCDELTRARVRAAGGGSPNAQRWLAEAVLPDVRVIARSLSPGSADADDACQFALLQILKAAARFRGDASVRHWARRVATRAVLKHRRRLFNRRAREQVYDEELDGGRVPGALEELRSLSDELPRSLHAYLEELPNPQREALVLRHALGYSLAEIAELTDVSPNTVKGRLRLGTKAMRRQVRQDRFLHTNHTKGETTP